MLRIARSQPRAASLSGGSTAAGGELYSASFSSSQPQKKKSDFAFS